MKKILIGAILASSLAISGNIKDCSYNLDQQSKYFELWSDTTDEWVKLMGREDKHADFKKKEYALYSHMEKLWKKQAKEDCKGVLDGENYNYATTGSFKKK